MTVETPGGSGDTRWQWRHPVTVEPGWVLKPVWTLGSRHNSISAVGNRTKFYRSSDGSLITIITELLGSPSGVPTKFMPKFTISPTNDIR